MRPSIESLESRTLLSVTSIFDPLTGDLDISSDASDVIVVSMDAATNEVLVNDEAVDDTEGGTVTADELTSVTVEAGPGDDVVDLSDLDPGTFPDLIGTDVSISGGEGADLITGSGLDDLIDGDAGNDTIDGQIGDDSVWGGDGHDSLLGDAGDDTLNGEQGDDTLNGGGGSDFLSGEDGDDVVRGQGSSLDMLSGGTGNDVIDGGAGHDLLQEQSRDVDYTLDDTTLIAVEGESSETDQLTNLQEANLSGGPSANLIDGSGWWGRLHANGAVGHDTIIGGDGADRLFGGSGQDTIDGGNGDDVLRGQGGFDTIAGGDGFDTTIGEEFEMDEDYDFGFDGDAPGDSGGDPGDDPGDGGAAPSE
jgi:Ca2+-binding RTX toxin-like protein